MFTRYKHLVIIFLLCIPLLAQSPLTQLLQGSPPASAKAADRLGRDTPYGTVYGFLAAAQGGDYSLAAQYLQMSPARRLSEGDADAMKLKFVMDRAFTGSLRPSRAPEGTPQEDVPLDRQKLGTMSAGDVEDELELVRVPDPASGKIWLISADSLAKVAELYNQVKGRQVETHLPAWLVRNEIGGVAFWQWFALILLLPIAAAAGWVVLMVFQLPLRWWARRRGQAELEQSRALSPPLWLLLGAITHRILASYLGLALLPRHYYNQITAIAVIIGANWILWRAIRWSLRRVRNRALALGHGGTGSLMLLGERMIKACIVVVGVFLILGILGVNLTTALAGLGIGGLAIGFGAQQTIANLFGGVSVLGDEVIHVGDVCKFGDRTGTVEDIGLRSTRVRTEERTLLAIPNGTVATINVENLSRREKILFKTVLPFHLDTTSDQLRSAMDEIERVLKNNPKIEASSIRVRLVEISPSALNIELVCYVLTQDYNTYAEVREDALLKIMRLVEDSGASLAKPSQTLYLSSDDSAAKNKLANIEKPAAPKSSSRPS
ncbi:MAG TPA: mechanosensitive ion channel family protein [Candidatus Binatia bacterium]|nr:mechanosensitive ion channel family protein [Candidatus Binatia bacterium]